MLFRNKFFTKEEDKMIVKSIKNAELKTSGEIRVFVESKCKIHVNDRAIEVFTKLKMHETANRNGVLVYIATSDKKFAIFGDEGIHSKLGFHFWVDASNTVRSHAIEDQIATGICKVIDSIGSQLHEFFPNTFQQNELPDRIEYGE
jgi:uncharacterized membrane protein